MRFEAHRIYDQNDQAARLISQGHDLQGYVFSGLKSKGCNISRGFVLVNSVWFCGRKSKQQGLSSLVLLLPLPFLDPSLLYKVKKIQNTMQHLRSDSGNKPRPGMKSQLLVFLWWYRCRHKVRSSATCFKFSDYLWNCMAAGKHTYSSGC